MSTKVARRRCGAKKRQGDGTCVQPAGWGTDHAGIGRCKFHGGSTPNHQRAANTEKARRALESLGVAVTTDPVTALLHQVWEAAGNVEFLRALVAELKHEVYGPDHLGDGRPHVVVVMYGEERDRLARVSKMAVDAGVATAHIHLMHQQGELVAQVIRAMLDEMALPAKKRQEGLRIAARHLRAVS